jgi:hypothetical protein
MPRSFSTNGTLRCPSRLKGRQMIREFDPVALEQAIRERALPPCLHVPVAARDEAAIKAHFGDVIEIISPGKAR